MERFITQTAAALSDSTRYQVLASLGARGLSMGEIADAVSISPATTTYHVHRLEDAGLVEVSRRGRCHVVRRVQRRWAQLHQAFGR